MSQPIKRLSGYAELCIFFPGIQKKELKEKVEIITSAYLDLIKKTADDLHAEEAHVIEEQQAAELEQDRLEREEKALKMEAAANEINTLQTELADLQEEISHAETKQQTSCVNRDRLGNSIIELSLARMEHRNALNDLAELDQTIQNNFFGTWTLTDEEKFRLGKLEHDIFGEVQNKLNEKEYRTSGQEIINQKIQETSDAIQAIGEQLSQLHDEITELTETCNLQKETLLQKKEALEELITEYKDQGLLPSDDDVDVSLPIEGPSAAIEEPTHKPLAEQLIDKPLDYGRILYAQQIENSPLFNNKVLYASIFERNDFYNNGVCPALKSACLVLTANQAAADDLFTKWDNQIKNLGTLWKESGSMDQAIDTLSLNNPFNLIEKLHKFNQLIATINCKELKLNDFIQNLSNASIPKDIQLDLQMPLSEALLLLEKSRNEETDLSPLFSDPTFKAWPKEVQYLTAMLTLKFYTNLNLLETDPEYRSQTLAVLRHTASLTPPSFATAFANIAVGNSWIFNASISLMAKTIIPMIKPKSEEDDLQMLSNFYVPDRDKLQDAIEFSKTSKRKKFDKARLELFSTMVEDVVEAVIAKHTTDDSKIGKKGKEFNLQKLILNSLKNSQTLKTTATAMIEYLEELEKPTPDLEELKKKKAIVEAMKGASIGCSLEFYKSLSQIVAKSGNVQILLNKIDENVLPDVLEHPLDLEETPVHEWLQHRIFKHL